MSERAARPTDTELLAQVAVGDLNAFEEIYRRYVATAYGLALRRLRDPGRAVEAVQELFGSLWHSARTYRRERETGARWLFALASRVLDRYETPARAAAPRREEDSEAAWQAWRVHRALEELPESDRETLARAYWSEPSRSPAGVPPATARARSALRALAEVLEDEELA